MRRAPQPEGRPLDERLRRLARVTALAVLIVPLFFLSRAGSPEKVDLSPVGPFGGEEPPCSLAAAVSADSNGVPVPPAATDSTGSLAPAAMADSIRRIARPPVPFDSMRAAFSISILGETCPYRLTAVSVMPEQEIEISACANTAVHNLAATCSAGTLQPDGPRRWRWLAPADPGSYRLQLRALADSIEVVAFVLTPYDGAETINGFNIGCYEREPFREDSAFVMPRGLIEVTEANRRTQVSPHFRLEQFLCKQEGGYPKYVLLSTRLLLRLEHLLETFAAAGFEAESLRIMSGYRTPCYNAAIGNETRYSRHLYGDAADVYIDADCDDCMDDLDGDGEASLADAIVLRDVVEATSEDSAQISYVGGLGAYGPEPESHGPFIHLDTRGYRARW